MSVRRYNTLILNVGASCRMVRFTSGIHRTGGWVSSRAGLDDLEKRKICCSCQESNRDPQMSSP